MKVILALAPLIGMMVYLMIRSSKSYWLRVRLLSQLTDTPALEVDIEIIHTAALTGHSPDDIVRGQLMTQANGDEVIRQFYHRANAPRRNTRKDTP